MQGTRQSVCYLLSYLNLTVTFRTCFFCKFFYSKLKKKNVFLSKRNDWGNCVLILLIRLTWSKLSLQRAWILEPSCPRSQRPPRPRGLKGRLREKPGAGAAASPNLQGLEHHSWGEMLPEQHSEWHPLFMGAASMGTHRQNAHGFPSRSAVRARELVLAFENPTHWTRSYELEVTGLQIMNFYCFATFLPLLLADVMLLKKTFSSQ